MIELGTGKSNGIIAIPERLNGIGWEAFMRKVRVLKNSHSYVFPSENRVSYYKIVDSQITNRKEVGPSNCRDTSTAPYPFALKAPTKNSLMNKKFPMEASEVWNS